MSTNDQLSAKAAIEAMPCCPHVLFVGMHNKPGMEPLDSKTMSGKMIDAVIKGLPFKCTKTNLFEGEYLPKDFLTINQAGIDWHNKYEPQKSDIVVLLGKWVQTNFWHDSFKIINLPHPASCMGNVNKKKYIIDAIERITKKMG
jgi:hypothetical protein